MKMFIQLLLFSSLFLSSLPKPKFLLVETEGDGGENWPAKDEKSEQPREENKEEVEGEETTTSYNRKG